MPNFTAKELTEICLNVFQKLNISAAEAEVVTQSMVDANRVGHDSHGVIHLPKYVRELEDGVNPARCTDGNLTRICVHRGVRWELGIRSCDCDTRR